MSHRGGFVSIPGVEATEHAAPVSEALAGPQSAIVPVDDIDSGLTVVDAEHLKIQTRDAVAARLRNAGAIFVGQGFALLTSAAEDSPPAAVG